jgi:hypothetical protein
MEPTFPPKSGLTFNGLHYVISRYIAIGDRVERPCYLSMVDLNRKIRSRKQKTDIGKYSFVNRTIQVWNQLPAEVLGTLSCKPSNFRKRVRKVINKANLRGY